MSRPYYANQRPLWLRHDAHLWIRHDVKRFLKPGTDPADVIPALRWRRDRERDREDAAFAEEIEKGYRLIATLRKEVALIRADLLRRRLAEQTKYSPSQPRVPAGNPRGAALHAPRRSLSMGATRGRINEITLESGSRIV